MTTCHDGQRGVAADRFAATAAAKAEWLCAMRWRRAVHRAVAPTGLTFTRWLVLDAADALITEMGDAISQNAIALRTELDKMTISQVVTTLVLRGWIDRDVAFGRPEYRLWLTSAGERVLVDARDRVEVCCRRGAKGTIPTNGT